MIAMDCQTVWDSCLQLIREKVSSQNFKIWFEPIKPVNHEGNILTIQVPNRFFCEWLEEHYVTILKQSIRQVLGEEGKLEYQILIRTEDKKTISASNGKDSEIVNPFAIPGIKKLHVEPQLNSKYIFETYIEGDCNRLARSAGLAVANKPGETAFNPLVVYGDVGLGKTHLAEAIGNEIVPKFPQLNVLYVSTEKFASQIIQAIRNNAINDFINFYQMIDVLLVDDIQFLANKPKTQEIFFHIFNQLHRNKKQLVITSDRPPKDLDGIQERLISRFKWGLTADLQTPDLETRIAILQSKLCDEGVQIPDNVIEYVCYHVQDNIRELEGVLVSIIAQASLNRKKIDIDIAKEVIRQFVTQISRQISIDSIRDLVAEHFSIGVDRMESKTRKREVVVARQVSMFLAKKLTSQSLKAIGERFGGRDHSTVIYSCNTVQDLMDTDNEFKTSVLELEKKINLSLDQTISA